MSYTLDLQKIADELDFDLEDVEMLLEVFLQSAQESLNALKDAVEANDFESIFASAHAIKGSAANILLDDVATIAKEMEHSARENREIDYLDSYEKLKSLISDIEA